MSKADKSGIVYSEKISYFSLVTNTIYTFFTVANRGYFDNLGLHFFLKKVWKALFLSDITLRMYARKIKQLTSHFDVTFELTLRLSARDFSPTVASSGFLKPQISFYPFIKMILYTIF